MATRWKVVNEHRESVVVRGELARQYNKGSIVKADPRTMGVMTFERRQDAENFIDLWRNGDFIIKVQGIGRGIKPKRLACDQCSSIIIKWYENNQFYNQSYYLMSHYLMPPKGTICYKSVLVLE